MHNTDSVYTNYSKREVSRSGIFYSVIADIDKFDISATVSTYRVSCFS